MAQTNRDLFADAAYSRQITKAASYTFTTFNIPGLEEVFGINDKGQVVGWSIQGDAAYGFLYSNRSYTSIKGPDTHDYFTSRAFGTTIQVRLPATQ